MTVPSVLAMLGDAMWVVATVCAPLLLVTSVIGLIVSLLQAITQLQEPALTFVPKMVASGLVILAMGSWMLQSLVEFVVRMISGPAGP